jgi:hypothetical protein
MTLREWIDRYGRGAINLLHMRTGLACQTVSHAARDGAKTRRVAEALSAATVDPETGEPAVSVAEVLGL